MFYLILLLDAISLICLGALIKNELVYSARNKILDSISMKAQEDIAQGKRWQWRYEEYRKVTYTQMMYQFWVRPEALYKDKSFYQ